MNGVMAWIRALRGYTLPTGLGLLNIAMIGFWFVVLAPGLDALDLDLRKLRALNNNLGNQIAINTLALETIDENRDRFTVLRKRGFIDPQNRL
ncbi:hypothetical protein LCGC14_2870350, partial [marine sediment metagenome]